MHFGRAGVAGGFHDLQEFVRFVQLIRLKIALGQQLDEQAAQPRRRRPPAACLLHLITQLLPKFDLPAWRRVPQIEQLAAGDCSVRPGAAQPQRPRHGNRVLGRG